MFRYNDTPISPYLTPEEQQDISNRINQKLSLVGKPILRAADYAGGITRTAFNAPYTTKEDWQQALIGNAPSGSEYVGRMGIKNPYAKAIIGFGEDIALDPVTFMGPAGIFKAFTKGTKAIDTISDLNKTTKAISSTFKPVKELVAEEKAINEALAIASKPELINTAPFITGIQERVGSYLQRKPFTKIDRNLAKEGATPISAIVKEHNLSGGGDALIEGLDNVRGGIVKYNEQIYNSPAAFEKIISKENIVTDDIINEAKKAAQRSGKLNPELNNVVTKLEAFKANLPKKMSLAESREYMADFGDIVKNYNQFNPNTAMDKALKRTAKNLRNETEKVVKITHGKDVAKQFIKNNKDLQSIILSSEPIYNKVASEASKPLISQIDATMGGLFAGRMITGAPAAPIGGAIAGKTIASMVSDKAMVAAGRMLEKSGQAAAKGYLPTVGKAMDTASLKLLSRAIEDKVYPQEEKKDPFDMLIEQKMREKGIVPTGNSDTDFDALLEQRMKGR